MITLEYCAEGKAITEFDYEEWTKYILDEYNNNKDTYCKLSTEIPFMVVRKAIAEGAVDCKDVTFVFDGKSYTVSDEGNFKENLPSDRFRVTFDLFCAMRRAAKKKNKVRENCDPDKKAKEK
jgi:hypothetical protein